MLGGWYTAYFLTAIMQFLETTLSPQPPLNFKIACCFLYFVIFSYFIKQPSFVSFSHFSIFFNSIISLHIFHLVFRMVAVCLLFILLTHRCKILLNLIQFDMNLSSFSIYFFFARARVYYIILYYFTTFLESAQAVLV